MRQYRVYDLSGTGAPDFYNGTELMLAWRIVDNRNGMRWSLYSILATTKHRSNHANVSIKIGAGLSEAISAASYKECD